MLFWWLTMPVRLVVAIVILSCGLLMGGLSYVEAVFYKHPQTWLDFKNMLRQCGESD